MAYNQNYRQPQRPYQDEYYNGEQPQQYAHQADQRGAPMQQGRGLPRFASQPGGMNANYRNEGMAGGGAPGRGYREQAQGQKLRRPQPPVTAMNDNDGGNRPMPRQRGPPPNDPIPRSQTMQGDTMRGRPPPNFARGGGPGGYPPPEELGPQSQRGPPAHQRLPPPRGNMPGPGLGGRGFPPGRPPVRQNTMGGYEQQRRDDPYQNQYNNGYVDDHGYGPQSDSGYGPDPGFGPPQRSMTMPSNVQYQDPNQHSIQRPYPQQQQLPPQQQKPQQQQYTAYNPSHHGTPVNFSAPRTAYTRPQAPPEEEYGRESVGALLDEYYNAPDPADGYGYQEAGILNYYDQPNPSGHPADSYQNGRDGYAPDPKFAQQAHRARSQPDLRAQARGGPAPPVPANGYNAGTNANHYQNGGQYDGAREMPAEMPGDLPLDEPIVMTANGFPPPPPLQSNIPMVLRVGSPAPQQQIRTSPQPPPPQQQLQLQPNALPPRSASVNPPNASADSLPYHPSPASTRFSSDSGRYSHSNGLPAHPPPIRPGLLPQQDQASVLSNHPPPRRQYTPDNVSVSTRRTSVQQGPITQFEFNQFQQAARANPGDNKLQLLLAKKMVEAAAVLADEGGRADARTTRKNRENYIFDAHKIVKKLANSSHPYPDAMFYLAECYWEGLLGLQVDRERAFNMYQSAAKLNHGPSAYRTAVCCELGAGTRKDPLKSMTWYKKASSLGDTAAMYKLGMIMLKGLLGQPKNGREAINWLKRAADQADENNPHALHQLGLIYEQADSGDFVIPDQNYARELYMKAAELGYPPSQFRIGCAFEYGTTGCPIDPMQSISWYSRAALQGEEESAMALSGWYLTGAEGVIKQSDTEAYLWARKAAERGLANAEYALGYFTEVGIGVTANLDEAKRWYYKAASQEHDKAKQRLQELKKGGAAVQKSRERLSRSNVKNKDGDCIIM